MILVYCGLRAVTPLGVCAGALAALATAFAIEFGQLFGLLDLLGLRGYPVARVVLGTGFDPIDFVAGAAGALGVAAARAISSCRRQQRSPGPSWG